MCEVRGAAGCSSRGEARPNSSSKGVKIVGGGTGEVGVGGSRNGTCWVRKWRTQWMHDMHLFMTSGQAPVGGQRHR